MKYDDVHKVNKPGRPRWSGKFTSSKCDVRLTSEENDMLNELAERKGVSRSDVMRTALKELHKFNSED